MFEVYPLVVFKLLQREDVLVKVFLKFLVCIVNVELLKAVDLSERETHVRLTYYNFFFVMVCS